MVKPRSATTWFCFIFNFIVCVRVVCLQAYLYTTWVPCEQGGQKRGLDTLKLDLRNSGSLEKQSVIITTKLSPQPSITCVFVNKVLLGHAYTHIIWAAIAGRVDLRETTVPADSKILTVWPCIHRKKFLFHLSV